MSYDLTGLQLNERGVMPQQGSFRWNQPHRRLPLLLRKAIEITLRRVRAIERVFIPQVQCALAHIIVELDERELEELHRLTKVQEKKKIPQEKSERHVDHWRAAGEVTEPAHLLAEEGDEGLLFEPSFLSGAFRSPNVAPF
ncbi:hypothetical protein HJG60_012121 [Phyllostomus discolor]|uniref:V-type proton ATPase subunit D n=1 Tax=Phyllostomus discolor TaxID=89673 RepID=A0A833ZJU5_9CHIR|nr:hypothetical protein HJG60_012121 [Phyllostomus discolor]